MSKKTVDEQLEALNESQLKSVTHIGTPLLILAGPGSGKTRVITVKVAWLIAHCNIPPQKILALTFTNKAAREMKERVLETMEPTEHVRTKQPFVSTFHSFGAWLLRWFCKEAGLPRNFQIYDQADQLALLKSANPNLDAKKTEGILRKIAFLKERGIRADSNNPLMKAIDLDNSHYQQYEKIKAATGNVDFGDLLLLPYYLLKERTDLLKILRDTWSWFLIDEYQDTNLIQFLFLQLICSQTANFCVVGDDDQSIYKFRGAVVENILKFEQHFPHSSVMRLEENYRSTPQILALANDIVSWNRDRHDKKIFSKKPEAEKPNLLCFVNEEAEKAYIKELAQQTLKEEETLGIFFRINAFSRACETALVEIGVSYSVIGATMFYAREEIKNALAILRVYKNPRDIVSLQRIINVPARGIGANARSIIIEQMKEGSTWQEAVELCSASLTPSSAKGVKILAQCFDEDVLQRENSIGNCLQHLLKTSGLWQYYTEKDKVSETERIQNIQELISYSSDFQNTEEGWTNFFERISLVEQSPNQKDSSIQLMSLHRSKGLEFDNVLICGIEDGLFPLERGEDVDYEEERRLLYVGVTRARKKLILSYCRQRRQYGYLQKKDPSAFVHDIDSSVVIKSVYRDGEKHGSSFEDEDSEGWHRGCMVEHDDHGKGYVKQAMRTDKHLVVEVEFTSGYEAMFIPRYTPKLRKAEENNEL